MDELPAEVLARIAEALPLRDLVRGLARACRTLGRAAQREVRREREANRAAHTALRHTRRSERIDPAAWGLPEMRPYAALAARVLPLLAVTADSLPDMMPRETFETVELGARVVAGCALRSGTPHVLARVEALLPVPGRVRVLAALDGFTPLPEAEPLALLRPGSRVRVTSGGDGSGSGDGSARDYVFLPDPDRVALYLWCDAQGCVLEVLWQAVHLRYQHRDAVSLSARCRLMVELTGDGPLNECVAALYHERSHCNYDWFDPRNEHGRRRTIDAVLAHGLPVTALLFH